MHGLQFKGLATLIESPEMLHMLFIPWKTSSLTDFIKLTQGLKPWGLPYLRVAVEPLDQLIYVLTYSFPKEVWDRE